MDRDLEKLPANNDDLLIVAAHFARDISAQCRDVSTMIFPLGHRMPSEQMIFAAAAKLRLIVKGIEAALTGRDDTVSDKRDSDPESWNLLVQSGFLKESALIDFVLARHAEGRLNVALASRAQISVAEQLPAILLSEGDAVIADTAQALLASESLLRYSPQLLYRELLPEYLHLLVWRIVAVLQVIWGDRNADHIARAKSLLAAHDESQSGRVAARKLVHFLPTRFAGDALDPEKAGLAVFVAALSVETTLEHDHILRLIDGYSIAPLAALLRYSRLDRQQAMAVICLFKGFDLTPHDITVFDENYERLDRDMVRAAMADWAAERLKFLTIPADDLSNAR